MIPRSAPNDGAVPPSLIGWRTGRPGNTGCSHLGSRTGTRNRRIVVKEHSINYGIAAFTESRYARCPPLTGNLGLDRGRRSPVALGRTWDLESEG